MITARTEQNRTQNGIKWKGTKWSGVEEWSGVGWDGVERNGTEQNITEHVRTETNRTELNRTGSPLDLLGTFLFHSLSKSVMCYLFKHDKWHLYIKLVTDFHLKWNTSKPVDKFEFDGSKCC